MNETVKLNNLSIKSKKDILVRNVSLTIDDGEIFGLVGESGSGKTLTAKSMINLLPTDLSFTADEIYTANKDLLKMSSDERRAHIGKNVGYIPQNTVFYLHPMIKIKNQIGDGYIYHMKKSKKEALEKASMLLAKMGFDNPRNILNLYPWQLSGGMRQRVNIAMALINDPDFISDEGKKILKDMKEGRIKGTFYVNQIPEIADPTKLETKIHQYK